MKETLDFMHARVVALDAALKKYKKDREIAMSALARLIAERGGFDEFSSAPADLAKAYLNNEVNNHQNSLIKFEWNYESAQIQNDKHQG
jgi:hypothetical protein